MTLKALIQEHDLAATAPAEAKATLEAKTIERTDADRKTIADITANFGRKRLLEIAAKLNELGMGALLNILVSGADFSHTETQCAIEDLAAAKIITAEEAVRLKAIGIWHVSPLEEADLDPAVTVKVIETAQQQNAAEQATEQLQAEWADLCNSGINQALANGDRPGLAAKLRAAADILEV